MLTNRSSIANLSAAGRVELDRGSWPEGLAKLNIIQHQEMYIWFKGFKVFYKMCGSHNVKDRVPLH